MQPTVLILASGANSRFFPLNSYMHKAGYALAGRSILSRVLENLEQHGYEDVVITVNPRDMQSGLGLRRRVESELTAQGSRLEPRFVVQDRDEQIGMAGAVLAAASELGENFVVANPYYLDLGTRIDSLLEKNGAAIGIVETDRPWEYGVVELDDGQVTNIVEKPAQGEEPSSLKTMVLHQLNADFLEILKAEANEEYAYESALKQYISTQSVQASHQQPYQTLKYCWHLFDFFNEIMENRETHIDDAASVAETAIIDDSRGPVIVEAGARVGDFAKIAGPCYIGSDALVGDYSFVRGSQIAAGSTVGAYTEVVRSLIFEKTSIHQSYLADSILDREVKVGAGLTTANKRLDRTEIRSMVKEKLRQTDRRAFGLAVGRGAQIGIDVSSMPGMLIAPDAEVLPKTNIERNIL